ncbi:MAG: cell division protein FtsQ/DivIB [Steroidobacterales bacterium]
MLKRKRNNRRSPQNAARWRWRWPQLNWRRIGLSAGGLAALLGAVGALIWLLDQPIERVVVAGRLQRVSAMDVEKVVRRYLHGAGLVSVNLEQISAGLRALPWIDAAAVARSWPRGLKVEVREQTAVARWNNAGLLNARGELFASEARFVPPELPLLSGAPGAQTEVTARYLASAGRLVEAGMRLAALDLDARGAWTLTLDSGVVVRLGRRQIDERFERFMAAAAKLVNQRAGDIGYVDMRYSNGFAVGWKGGRAHADG